MQACRIARLIGYDEGMSNRAQNWMMIYGLVLLTIFNFAYKLLSPEHRFYSVLASWRHFLIFVIVGAAVAFTLRWIALRKFGSHNSQN